ncbi:EpsG family protein [Acinetobacter cumulans]|uniref:EpsG family protein n=1 Tax=Acinetobacter cumulans TaxID=2136182 RepID=A0A3A8FMX0_9GAMM|nr:EpsG family protein [Acinetobacter cumulans]RKG48345.1 EpsG family protein [Acinetobacter cumulans]
MAFYIIIWFFISFFSLPFNIGRYSKIIPLLFLFLLFLYTGLRFEVGGDWDSYLYKYDKYNYINNFSDFISISEPGYGLINLLSIYFNVDGIYFVNSCCALIFYLNFYFFNKRFKNILFPLFVCFTYTIIVVTTGYTRQSVAMGFILLAISGVLDQNKIKFFLGVFLAVLFHNTAFLFLIFSPFLFKNLKINNNDFLFYLYSVFSISFILVLLYFATLGELNSYTETDGKMSSGGVYMRLLMHVIPILYYIYYRPYFLSNFPLFYRFFDYNLIFIVVMFFLASFLSTLVDRLNLYFFYFDILVLLFVYIKSTLEKKILCWVLVFVSNSVVLILWLNFGKWTALKWIPYQNYFSNYILNFF